MSMGWPPGAGRRSPRLWTWGTVSLLVLFLLGGSPPEPKPVPKPGADASPMDEPLRLLAAARKAFDEVNDYTCLLIKRERIDGQVLPDNVMQMKFRKEPFSVGLVWLQPKNLVGQEAYYINGRNDNKLRVRGAGGLGLFGFVSLDPNDPRVKATSKYSITDAGIGNMVRRFTTAWEMERKLGLTKVNIAEYEYNKRRCMRVETIHPLQPNSKFLFYRSVVYFDKEHKLPIRVECYDWPTEPGDTKGIVAEIYSFAHLKLNVGLEDEAFVR
jgi:Protein of unknown function (DUF1571)